LGANLFGSFSADSTPRIINAKRLNKEPPTTTTKRAEISRCRVEGRREGKYGIYLDECEKGRHLDKTEINITPQQTMCGAEASTLI